MEKIDKKLLDKYNPPINVIHDNKYNNVINVSNADKSIYDINDISSKKGKYALDYTKFTPHTEESQLAEQLAKYFEDLDNFAFYFRVVKKLGVDRTHIAFRGIQEEIKEKKGTRYEILSPKKYFAWKYRKGLL